MAKTPSRSEKLVKVGAKDMTIEEKILLLRERYKRLGEDLADTIGVTRVTLSRWVNGHVGEIKEQLWTKLVTASRGFISEDDRPTHALVDVKPEPKPVAKPTPAAKPVKPTPKDDDEFIL
jgi:DNA-binding XRE family transcriptional regulator